MKRILMFTLIFTATTGLTAAAMAADGAAVYKTKCALCHGADGQGSPMGPAFKGSEFITSGSNGEITGVILKGRTGDQKKYKNIAVGMPAQSLDADDAGALVKYLKSLASK